MRHLGFSVIASLSALTGCIVDETAGPCVTDDDCGAVIGGGGLFGGGARTG